MEKYKDYVKQETEDSDIKKGYNSFDKSSANKDSNVGIRSTLRQMGFSNSDIGYNEGEGIVTLKGKNLIKPKYIDEEKGISYSPKADIEKSLVDYYKNSSNPIVRVSDAYSAAAGSAGISADALTYGNGTVMIGGIPLNTLYVDDQGKAWAWKSDVDDLTNDYLRRVGAKSPVKVMDEYNREYLSQINEAIDDLKNTKEFTYDPNDDPVFLAYRDMYRREGERAGQDTIAKYAGLTGGYVNSAAVTAAGITADNYAKAVSDMIPTLAESAYERYKNDYQAKLSLTDKMIDAYKAGYSGTLSAVKSTADNINSVAESNTARDDVSRKSKWEDLLNNVKYQGAVQDIYWEDILNDQKVETNQLKNLGYDLDNNKKSTYLKYYEKLLNADLEGDILDNSLSKAKLHSTYGY